MLKQGYEKGRELKAEVKGRINGNETEDHQTEIEECYALAT